MSVIDTATGVVSASIDVGGQPAGVAITPDGRHAYVTGTVPLDGTVWVIDTATGVVSATIPVGPNPGEVAITPDGTHAYVADYAIGGGGEVSVIETTTGQVWPPSRASATESERGGDQS